jgi:hypothetical protein
MLEKRRADRRVIGLALLGSAAVFLAAGIAVASGVFALAPSSRRIATIVCCGTAFVDALIAAKFLSSAAQ